MRQVLFDKPPQQPLPAEKQKPRQVILEAKSAEDRAVQKEQTEMKAPAESGPKPPTDEERIDKAEKELQTALKQLEDIKTQEEIRDKIGRTSTIDNRLQERKNELAGNIKVLKAQLENLRKGPMLADERSSSFPHRGEYFG